MNELDRITTIFMLARVASILEAHDVNISRMEYRWRHNDIKTSEYAHYLGEELEKLIEKGVIKEDNV